MSEQAHFPLAGPAVFDGDKLRHRIRPLREGAMRVSPTFECATDPKMHFWRRLVSNMKDAWAYFGFRRGCRRRARGGPGRGPERV
jgi:hypothetical protein